MNSRDERKRIGNLAKHGVDFRNLDALAWDEALIWEDQRRNYGETRLMAPVPLGSRLHAVVYTERDDGRRVISARKANSREVDFYEAETHPSDA